MTGRQSKTDSKADTARQADTLMCLAWVWMARGVDKRTLRNETPTAAFWWTAWLEEWEGGCQDTPMAPPGDCLLSGAGGGDKKTARGSGHPGEGAHFHKARDAAHREGV